MSVVFSTLPNYKKIVSFFKKIAKKPFHNFFNTICIKKRLKSFIIKHSKYNLLDIRLDN